MKSSITKILVVILIPFLLSCLRDESFKLPYGGFEPEEIDDDWIISTPEDENMDSQILESAFRIIHEEDRYKMIRSLLVIRNGKLLAEAYPRDSRDIEQIGNLQSATKSVTSILTGIAFELGLLDSLSQRISSIYPEMFTNHPDKYGITIKQVLTMSTGIGFNNSEHTGLLCLSDRSVDFVLSLPLISNPGTSFNYNDGNPQLISYAIEYRYGKPLAVFADECLFKPLGITDWLWESAPDGISFGAFSLYLKPRDMAKIGQMLIQNGQWEGRHIVDSTWIALATQSHYEYRPYWVYGYYFWISPFEDIFYYNASGHGGQMIVVVPGKNLVIVSSAWPYSKHEEPYVEPFMTLLELIIESCD